MPPPLHQQTVIAFVWDFDKTLIPSNMQDPIFEEYGVDPGAFWGEVDGLVDHYRREGVIVQKDTAYLGHLLTYVREGIFGDLSNEKLVELGSRLEPVPGMPQFMQRPPWSLSCATGRRWTNSLKSCTRCEGSRCCAISRWYSRKPVTLPIQSLRP